MVQKPKEETRSRLLHAGIKEFGAHGFRGASLRDIAKAANTNVAAIKYHFGSKEHLWRAAVSHLYRCLGEAIMADEAGWPLSLIHI